MIDSRAIERAFDAEFAAEHRTVLRGGFDEPWYLPPGQGPGEIRYTRDYASSALHEVAHWCVAGPHRRTLPDWGYWYVPDGRSDAQQGVFEQVEVRPQALEWLFSEACGQRFVLSADNLRGDARPSPAFAAAVQAQRDVYAARLPGRAARFVAALRRLR